MGVSHYIILMLIVCSLYWAFISLMDMLESKKRLKEKKEALGKGSGKIWDELRGTSGLGLRSPNVLAGSVAES